MTRGAGWRHVGIAALAVLLFNAVYVAVFSAVLISHNPGLTGVALNEELLQAMSTTGPGLVGGLAALWLGLLTGVFLAGRATAGGWRTLVGWGFDWRRDIPLGLAVAGAVQGLSVLVGLLAEQLNLTGGEDLGNTGSVTSVTGPWLPVVVICAVIGAPLVEELFFRGLLLPVVAKRWGATAGVIISSLAFGAMHVQTTAASSVYTVTLTALIGAVLAIIRLRTGRLGPAIVAHVMINGLGLALAALFIN
jgi:uncharacterized protein